MEKTMCELFAGVGGFRVGLEKSDSSWNTVWANQWEPGKKSQHAFDCYVKNFGENKKGNYTKSQFISRRFSLSRLFRCSYRSGGN